MTETIGIVASIIGIIGAILATIKFVFNPYFKKQEEYKYTKKVINESYDRWIHFEYAARGSAMIPDDTFLVVNKYKNNFKKKDKLKAYLLINAIQKGYNGDWGFWLCENKDNDKILLPLFILLNKTYGLRPQWRSAFILEKIFQGNAIKIDSFLAKQKKFKVTDSSILEIIKDKKVQGEMTIRTRRGKREEKEKLSFVLDEIESFSKEINAFINEQTINC